MQLQHCHVLEQMLVQIFMTKLIWHASHVGRCGPAVYQQWQGRVQFAMDPRSAGRCQVIFQQGSTGYYAQQLYVGGYFG